jgi:YfiH family protein
MTAIRPQLHYYNIGTRVVAFSTTRHGGVGQGHYACFNVNHYCGDTAEAVGQNRHALCELLGIGEQRLIYPHQTHHTRICAIDKAFLQLSEAERAQRLEGIDALSTREKGVCIGVSTADCIPVLLYDEEHGAVAAIHAGWRGTVGRIAEHTVQAMCRLGAKPQDIHATMGASICADCFEVGDEVPEAFAQAGFDMADIMQRNAATGKAHIDLSRANRQVLMAAGIPADHITLPVACSRCQSDRYFSARRLGINSGRTFTAIIKHQDL